jgi:formamidopyrimidine-DNA glycosylase
VVAGEAGLQSMSAGGVEPLEVDVEAFTETLRASNHTLKRALTDPHIFSGIGNAYSDEILHRAQLSPIAMTQKLSSEEIARLYEGTRATLIEWTERLREEAGEGFPEGVTAFRREMAVHGRYHEPCPRCGAKIQRIRYASNETNYCANCQTGGRLLADRALSRLMHQDWPRTLEELEDLKKRRAK